MNKELFQPEQYSETFLCKPAFCDKCAWHIMEINTHISVEFHIFISPPARLFSLKFPSIFVNNVEGERGSETSHQFFKEILV